MAVLGRDHKLPIVGVEAKGKPTHFPRIKQRRMLHRPAMRLKYFMMMMMKWRRRGRGGELKKRRRR